MHHKYATFVSKLQDFLATTALHVLQTINVMCLEPVLVLQFLVLTMEIHAFCLFAKNHWVFAILICLITLVLTVIVYQIVFKIVHATVRDSVVADYLFLAQIQAINA
jgi:hypothetical protein